MGQLIALGDRLEERSALGPEAKRPGFCFDLGCPFCYLAAERVERLLGEVDWVPVSGDAVAGDLAAALDVARAEERAAALRIPILWPERFPRALSGAMRVAVYASECGAGARFALAAFRFSFCGGYELDDREVLPELSSSVGIPRAGAVAAAADPSRDHALTAAARGLARRGVRGLPAFRVGEHFFEGESALPGAAALHRARRRAPVADLA
jgi:2-hydroxychromene-2-carboxylate isomerase